VVGTWETEWQQQWHRVCQRGGRTKDGRVYVGYCVLVGFRGRRTKALTEHLQVGRLGSAWLFTHVSRPHRSMSSLLRAVASLLDLYCTMLWLAVYWCDLQSTSRALNALAVSELCFTVHMTCWSYCCSLRAVGSACEFSHPKTFLAWQNTTTSAAFVALYPLRCGHMPPQVGHQLVHSLQCSPCVCIVYICSGLGGAARLYDQVTPQAPHRMTDSDKHKYSKPATH
jgi:hypothetical protein